LAFAFLVAAVSIAATVRKMVFYLVLEQLVFDAVLQLWRMIEMHC
jgi:hypothetical protein